MVSPLSRYRRPSDLPDKIPVFPLRGAILLPRAKLPLNVFEPRYLELLDYVMSGERVIGIIQPQATDNEEESAILAVRASAGLSTTHPSRIS